RWWARGGDDPRRRARAGRGVMVADRTHPLPWPGERDTAAWPCEAGPSAGWERGRAEQSSARSLRERPPLSQLRLSGKAAKPAHPSPLQWRGEEGVAP